MRRVADRHCHAPRVAERLRRRIAAGPEDACVAYLCFIESDILSVPHMEPLMAETLEDATLEARALLAQHQSGFAAHIFEDDRRVGTVRRGDDA